MRIAYVFYESGLWINVRYTVDDPKRRAVGFKLSEGMEVPVELASRFKFASRKSNLAGSIRGPTSRSRTSTDPARRGQASAAGPFKHLPSLVVNLRHRIPLCWGG
jgi:hypothetical protein